MDIKYLPTRHTNDPILEKMLESTTEHFWCSSCNCSRLVEFRVMKTVNGRHGPIKQARCTVCAGK